LKIAPATGASQNAKCVIREDFAVFTTISHASLGLSDMPNFGVLPVAAPPAYSFSHLFAFGDSLSDTGNVYTLTAGLLPTSVIYADGRFTNGRVWVQDLARQLGLGAVTPSLDGGSDYAYGGAETGGELLHAANPLDLPSQLAQFLATQGHAPANALYTLSIGGNDVIDAISAWASNPANALYDMKDAIGNEINFVQSLANDGARNFVILNVPDLGKTPQEAGNAAIASGLSSLYDSVLQTDLQNLVATDHLSIHLVDTYSLIDQAVADPAKFGLKNVTTPVWTGNFENPFSGHLNATGAAQNKYLFFDHLHPTATGHLAVADAAYSSLAHAV
jgi:phospholipase/lecithinase/hemolysin